MSRASDEVLGELHTLVVAELIDRIKNPPINPDTGKPIRVDAAMLNTARQMLKDNNIQSMPVAGSPIGILAGEVLPFPNIEAADKQTYQ